MHLSIKSLDASHNAPMDNYHDMYNNVVSNHYGAYTEVIDKHEQYRKTDRISLILLY